LHDEVTTSMPPSPTWLRGKATTVAFLAARPFTSLAGKALRLVPIEANGQPAVAFYVDGALHAVQVLRCRAGRVLELHHFADAKSLTAFALPAL
jgi:RNA polymerase sigma-70 factor, ECF subfamily